MLTQKKEALCGEKKKHEEKLYPAKRVCILALAAQAVCSVGPRHLKRATPWLRAEAGLAVPQDAASQSLLDAGIKTFPAE